MNKQELLAKIQGRLIVSCQALDEEPLHSPFIMARMAAAAKQGGAAAIRANSVEDIVEIRKNVNLPMIGIIKKVVENSPVYITPTQTEVESLIETGVEIIAIDATCRPRPDGKTLDEFFVPIRKKYPDAVFMADCSTVEEGMKAAELNFDLIGSTLTGYTPYTKNISLPAYGVMKEMVEKCGRPVIGEGGIWTPENLKTAFETGITAAVVGTAITRPQEITRRFVQAINS